jgi:hypothetical protein
VFFLDTILFRYNASRALRAIEDIEEKEAGGLSPTTFLVNKAIKLSLRTLSGFLKLLVPKNINEQRKRYLNMFTQISDKGIDTDIDSILLNLGFPVNELLHTIVNGLITSFNQDRIDVSALITTIIDTITAQFSLNPKKLAGFGKLLIYVCKNINITSFTPDRLIMKVITLTVAHKSENVLTTLINLINKFDDGLLTLFNANLESANRIKSRMISICSFMQSILPDIRDISNNPKAITKIVTNKANKFGMNNADLALIINAFK